MTSKTMVVMVLAALVTSGCVTETFQLPNIYGEPSQDIGSLPPEPAALSGPPMPDISPAARAALPPGIDPRFLMQGGDGCWVMVLEEREPANGVLLRNAAGEPVCD